MRKGFTLIELMVAVSVLAIGIVSVARARLNIVTALDTATTQMRALQILDEQMGVLAEEEKAYGGIEPLDMYEEIMIGNRPGLLTSTSSLIEISFESPEEEGQSLQEPEPEEELEPVFFYEVVMNLSWQEEAKKKEVSLATYFAPPLEEEEEEGKMPWGLSQ